MSRVEFVVPTQDVEMLKDALRNYCVETPTTERIPDIPTSKVLVCETSDTFGLCEAAALFGLTGNVIEV